MNGMNYVRFTYNSIEQLFLIDTGATVSVIFSDILASNSVIDKTEQVIINGIAGSTKAIGATNIPLSCQNNKIYHKFLVVNNINCDISGIIGIDFLSKHNAVIDFEQFSFSFWINTDKIILPLESIVFSIKYSNN